MKTMKKPSLMLLAALAALSGTTATQAQRSLTTTITEDFDTYAGTPGTLPADFSIDVTAPGTIYWGNSNGSGSPLNSGIYNFTNGTDKSFGILEGDQGSGDIADSRLLLHFTNNTGAAITRLRVRYQVQVWRDGARKNSIGLKYNTVPTGFGDQPTIVTTEAKVNAGGDVNYDGADPSYYTQVDVQFNLPSALPNGNSAYLRWQYSTASGSGRRDGLGIANIILSVATAGTDKAWGGSTPATWNLTDSVWGSAAWSNTGNYNAVFNSGSGTLTLGTAITAVDLKFNSTGYTIAGGGNALTLRGQVNVASGLTATVSAPIAGTSGLGKIGAGILELSGASTYTGTTSITDGTVKLLANNALPSTTLVQLGSTGKLDLNAYDLTVAGLQGDPLGEVAIPAGKTLTLTTTTNLAYQGKITGAGGVVKNGASRQRFRNQPKTYTGPTDVDAGTLEITENGQPTGTSALSLDGSSTEVLLSSDAANVTYAFGSAAPIVITGNAQLATDTGVSATLTNPIQVSSGGGTVTARGTTGSPRFTLTGAISGSGTLTRKGQALLEIKGNSNTYTGSVLLNNGITRVDSGVTLGAGAISVTVQGDNSSEKASLYGTGTIGGNVAYNNHTAVDLDQVGANPLVITGNLSGLNNLTITGSGNKNVFRVEGSVSGTLPSGVTVTSASPLAGSYVNFNF
jgi:autotransporter-associated beta strand protein